MSFVLFLKMHYYGVVRIISTFWELFTMRYSEFGRLAGYIWPVIFVQVLKILAAMSCTSQIAQGE
jgi:hypothetical protein